MYCNVRNASAAWTERWTATTSPPNSYCLYHSLSLFLCHSLSLSECHALYHILLRSSFFTSILFKGLVSPVGGGDLHLYLPAGPARPGQHIPPRPVLHVRCGAWRPLERTATTAATIHVHVEVMGARAVER